MRELYRVDDRTITDDDFTKALARLGVREGDTIFVHSDVGVFGKLAAPDKAVLLSSLVDILQASVGSEGTLVMPTFSYSFCKGELYDPVHTPSTVGTLTEFFRTQPGVRRSDHALFSVAARGKHAAQFLTETTDCFGAGTIFETLRKLDSKIIFFGTSFAASCTFIHHIEQMARVPYRFFKTFSGIIVEGEKQHTASYAYFVRHLDGTAEVDFHQFEKFLLKKRVLQQIPVGRGFVQGVRTQRLFDDGMRLLTANPNVLLARTPIN